MGAGYDQVQWKENRKEGEIKRLKNITGEGVILGRYIIKSK